MTEPGCLLFDAERSVQELNRDTVWEDRLWRLAMPRRGDRKRTRAILKGDS